MLGGVVFPSNGRTSQSSVLNCNVLLLNAHFAALRVVSVRRAFSLLIKRDQAQEPVAEVVSVEDGRFVSYDFEDWIELSALRFELEAEDHEWVRTVRVYLAAPRIVRVLTFSKLPRDEVKFNRRSVLARDDHRCQYCGRQFPTAELTLDHVIPRSQSGTTNWENVVCACPRCNVRKGGRTPRQAGLRLLCEPVKPKRNPAITVRLSDKRYSMWRPFLDRATWNVEHR